MIKVPKFFGLIVGTLMLAVIVYSTYARNNGSISGRTSTTSQGCDCHGNSNSSTSLSPTGTFTVTPNSSNSYSISVTNSNMSAAGINIAVKTAETGATDAGTLQAPTGSGLQVTSSELTHSTRKSMTDGTTSFTFNWTAPSTHGTYYLRAVGNAVNSNNQSSGDTWNWMPVQVITVKGITLTSPNGGQEYCLGSNQNITWNHTGLQNVKIELSTDGGNNYTTVLANSTPASSGSWAWTISNALTPGNQFRIRVSDADNSSNGDASDANFTIGGAPQITSHPQSQTGCTGQGITFTLSATGAGLSYQWRKGGNNISGATQPSLTLNNLTTSSEGSYDCVVSGQCGSPVTSNAANLSVDVTPSVLAHPQSQEVCLGQSVTFNIEAIGTDITYQWRKSGNDISGATSNSLTINNVSSSDIGLYTCRVSGKCSPAAVSNSASLTISPGPEITEQPQNASPCAGTALELKVTATGANLSYQWRRNGIELSNATSPTLNLAMVTTADSGRYDVIVKGTCNPPDTSQAAIVTISQKPVITQNPGDKSVIEGSEASFTVNANGSITSYQWRKDAADISGANSATFVISAAELSDAGKYDCAVTNNCGVTISIAANLEVISAGAGPVLVLGSTMIDFGIVKINSKKDTSLTAFLKNIGTEKLIISAYDVQGNEGDYSGNITLPIEIDPGKDAPLAIAFTPSTQGTRSAVISFTSNSESNANLTLTGVGGFTQVSASEEMLDFGTVQVGNSETINALIINQGNMPVVLSNFSVSGENAADFIFLLEAVELNLDPDSEIELPLMFAPSAAGERKAQFSLVTDDDETITVELTGMGEGTSVYDNLLIVAFDAYPNPANGRIIFRIESKSDAPLQMQIIDNFGSIIQSINQLVNTGSTIIYEWDGIDRFGNNVPSGTYTVRLISGEQISTHRFMISK